MRFPRRQLKDLTSPGLMSEINEQARIGQQAARLRDSGRPPVSEKPHEPSSPLTLLSALHLSPRQITSDASLLREIA
jgi:hypothetical protein